MRRQKVDLTDEQRCSMYYSAASVVITHAWDEMNDPECIQMLIDWIVEDLTDFQNALDQEKAAVR